MGTVETREFLTMCEPQAQDPPAQEVQTFFTLYDDDVTGKAAGDGTDSTQMRNIYDAFKNRVKSNKHGNEEPHQYIIGYARKHEKFFFPRERCYNASHW